MRGRLITGMLLAMVQIAFAGGILTNTNQSVQFARMLSRNASTEIDAVYFNPAGMTQLADGFHVAIHSQTISEERTVTSTLPTLNQKKYVGDVFVPVFPDLYAVYKKDKMAFALGFGPIAGGGSADFKNGLPDFETPISLIPTLVSAEGVPTTAYSADIAFKGSSVYYGVQVNASYAIHKMLSLSIGGRYNIARNSYEGSLGNIMINPNYPALGLNGSMIPAATFFAATGKTAETAATSNQVVDAKQTGSGITPIIGINIKPTCKMNIGLKYELATKLELENQTEKDLVAEPQFPDGEKMRNDIPAILSGGISYQAMDKMLISVGGNLYFDKNANRGGRENLIDSNNWEFQAGMQYAVNEKLSVSAGYQWTQTGVSSAYQSGTDYDLSANSIGAGARYCLGEAFALEFGGQYIIYPPFDAEKTSPVPHKITYEKSTWLIAVGLEYVIRK